TSESLEAVLTHFLTSDASRVSSSAGFTAGQVIRQRRSAVSFDGKTAISSGTFFQILSRVMPSAELPQLDRPMPWDVLPWKPAIHLLLFVHRVDGLSPGLYFLARDREKLPLLQQSMNEELVWTPVPGCPDTLPLYWLLEGDAGKCCILKRRQQGCEEQGSAASLMTRSMRSLG
ncbi:MAG: hypothetical protein K8R65_04850, partial [Nitrospirae bacterium]|nr:hypothetical protein [Nitrospirota bacterium]